MTTRPAHQQRSAYKLTAEKAGALLWYCSLPFPARLCLCSFVLRLTAGMGVEDAARLYHLEAGAGRGAMLPLMQAGRVEHDPRLSGDERTGTIQTPSDAAPAVGQPATAEETQTDNRLAPATVASPHGRDGAR